MTQIVKNDSDGYNYKYAALSDIAKQGFEIPKMKVQVIDGNDYVCYLDNKNEWQTGAKVVIPAGKGMNEAQLYGSALTYARRYTTLMALGLACDDDKNIEDLKPVENKKASKSQISLIKNCYDDENINKIINYYKVNSLEELTVEQASQCLKKKNVSEE